MASGTGMSAAPSPPRLEPNCDVRKLPISPTEAFILSRIDGVSGVLDLSNATGLPESIIVDALDHLSAVGAIVYAGARRSPPAGEGNANGPRGPAAAQAPDEPRDTREAPRAPRPDGGRRSGVERVVRYDRSLLDEEVDIPMDQRMDVLELFFSIDVVNHYDLLGVPQDADRKAIKQAYFERATILHPDRFFGKNIGSYRSRIERVFTALTKAHDTLTKRQSRADYDAYLDSRQETIGLRSSRLPQPPSQRPADEVRSIPPVPPPPSVAEALLSDPSARDRALLNPVLTEAALTGHPLAHADQGGFSQVLADPVHAIDVGEVRVKSDTATSTAPRSPQPSNLADDAARKQMARKLKGASQPPATGPPGDGGVDGARQALEANLRARYEARLKDPTAPMRFLALAAEAERAQSWASAVNALKAALDLSPDDPRVRSELMRVELLADRAYAGKFAEQARYEERDGQYERAARSYERAARGKNSGELYALAALCQLRADGGGRRAVELARRAVALGPTHVPSRIALARAYFHEGMTASALAELARALEVEPKNEEAKRLQGEFKKASSPG